MTALDRLLQRWRIERTRRFLRPGDRVLDVGSADGALFRALGWLGGGAAIDPYVEVSSLPATVEPVRERFPGRFGDQLKPEYDAVTLLAVLEHVPQVEQPAFAAACARALRPGGVALITVPGPAVDRILDVLMKLRLIDGMEVGQHYGFAPEQTVPLFEGAGLRLVRERSFQLGLNHFFAFRKL